MEEVYKLVDKYVQLTYLSKAFSKGKNNLTDYFNNGVVNIDFASLGFTPEEIEDLGTNPNFEDLSRYSNKFIDLADEVSREVFGTMINISLDERIQLKDYVDGRANYFMGIAMQYQQTYMAIVGQIDEAVKGDDKVKLRQLGMFAKINMGLLDRYQSYCQSLSNVSSYLRGSIGYSSAKK